ncbi:hypothetical protein [Evansella cellulosilytica]|uniref:Uncharacterized protein n=1 Tax=Evansella cellulosilytica (strain ATCC 21833 / DSM 2522 / FERM P-1141 / JCM 9156 / N-4) TaxID=649639 RepID=E6U1M6_EVAC2|nr:hypothetical protein [Evansella cellulosilytica]ADU30389.1 hypothetical protein Bcell_2128 [Evansella cellulosilytica DSM 2522]
MRKAVPSKVVELEHGVIIETFKWEHDQKLFNFVYSVPEQIAIEDGFAFEAGALFGGNLDLIDSIHAVRVKDGYLTIEGLKDREASR